MWEDLWSDQISKDKYPQIHSYCRTDNQSIRQFIQAATIEDNFHLTLSIQAYQQFQSLQMDLQNIQISENNDKWMLPGNSGLFSSMKIYKILKTGQQAPDIFKSLWKSAVVLRYKVFLWLFQDYNCALCDTGALETSLHLFWECPFSFTCWESINLNKNRGTSFLEKSELAQNTLPKNCAMEIIIMGCWNIWMQRNNIIFNGIQPANNSWKHLLKKDLSLTLYRIKTKYAASLKGWIDMYLP